MLAIDQRGLARPAGLTCDVGAYEAGTTAAAIVIATPEATPTSGIILIVTPTAAPAPLIFTFLQNANCRKGPGTLYDVVTALTEGSVADALARNDLASWYRIAVPDTDATCWVAGSTGEASGPIDGLLVEAGLPLPGAPGSLTIGQTTCTPNLNYFKVPLSWGDAGNETGYRLYRNGALLATLGANVTDYDDQAPKGQDLAYTLEAFNKVGISERIQASAGGLPMRGATAPSAFGNLKHSTHSGPVVPARSLLRQGVVEDHVRWRAPPARPNPLLTCRLDLEPGTRCRRTTCAPTRTGPRLAVESDLTTGRSATALPHDPTHALKLAGGGVRAT